MPPLEAPGGHFYLCNPTRSLTGMEAPLYQGTLAFCNHPHLAVIISGCRNLCSTGVGAWCPATLHQGTAGAKILPKVYGEKFDGGNKSGQLSILALVQNTDEGKISTIPLICSSIEALARTGCTA